MAAPFSRLFGKASVNVRGNFRVVLFDMISFLVVDCVITLPPSFPILLESSSIVVA